MIMIVRGVLLAGVMTFCVGCATDGDSELAVSADWHNAQWSTKEQSVTPEEVVLQPTEEPVPVLSAPEPPVQAHASAHEQAAVDLLHQAAASTNAQLRARSIEALLASPEHLAPVLEELLRDPNRGVRFHAAMAVGKLRLTRFVPAVRPLLNDRSDSVRAAAIYALRTCGEKPDMNPLAGMVLSDDPEVKGNAAMVLGELGDPSAIGLLKDAARRRAPMVPVARARVVELQIAEAIVKLGGYEEIEVIRSVLFAPEEQGELMILACEICGSLGDRESVPNLKGIAQQTGRRPRAPEVRLAAAHALAMIEPNQAILEPAFEFAGHDRQEIRSQAAVVMGWVGDPAALPRLRALMSDPNALVQVSAAGAILKVLSR
jgi:HEAT repeat protein